MIQTYNPDNSVIEYAKKQDYELFYNSEIKLREQLNYPPFYDIILIGISSNKQDEIIKASNEIYNIIRRNSLQNNIDLLLLKPVPSPIDKIKNKYRWRIIIKCKFNSNIVNLINYSLEEYYKKNYKSTRVTVDVNPNNMM